MIVEPLPAMMPPLQLPPFVSVSCPEPANVPLLMSSAPAVELALKVAVPLLILSVPMVKPTDDVTVAPLNHSVPAPLIVAAPLMLCVPPEKARMLVATNEPVCVP